MVRLAAATVVVVRLTEAGRKLWSPAVRLMAAMVPIPYDSKNDNADSESSSSSSSSSSSWRYQSRETDDTKRGKIKR